MKEYQLPPGWEPKDCGTSWEKPMLDSVSLRIERYNGRWILDVQFEQGNPTIGEFMHLDEALRAAGMIDRVIGYMEFANLISQSHSL